MGRIPEIVNIPSKLTPKGFKIWVLANEGYILDGCGTREVIKQAQLI
jgi:hypothetical protein